MKKKINKTAIPEMPEKSTPSEQRKEAIREVIETLNKPVDMLDGGDECLPSPDTDLSETPDEPDEPKETVEVPTVEQLKKMEQERQDAVMGKPSKPAEQPQDGQVPPGSPMGSAAFPFGPPPMGSESGLGPYSFPGGPMNDPALNDLKMRPTVEPQNDKFVPPWRTFDGSPLPTYEEALKQVVNDEDDFYLGGDFSCSNEQLQEFTSTIWYKVRAPRQPDGRDYKIIGMPKHPKFVERLGVKNISDASLMQVLETFLPGYIKSCLEQDDKNRDVVLVAEQIVSQMRKENRLYDGALTNNDMMFIAKYIPEYSEETIRAIKEYIRRVYEVENNIGSTLQYSGEPRLDCVISDLGEHGSKLDDGIPLTKEIVNAQLAAAKRVRELAEKAPKMPSFDNEKLKALFTRHADIPGFLFKRIVSLPGDAWNVSLERNLFSMYYNFGTRSIKIEVMLNTDKMAFFNINCTTLMGGGGEMKYHETYNTVDDMLKAGPNALKLLRFVASRFSSVIA